MKILAIDPAERTGWATSSGLFGMEHFKVKSGESVGFKLIRFKAFIDKIIKTEKIDIVVYERAGGRFPAANISHGKFVAMIEIVCIENKVEFRAYSSGEIKKHATGSGSAKKPDMIKAAIRKFKKPIKDDNIADAMWLLDLAQKDLS